MLREICRGLPGRGGADSPVTNQQEVTCYGQNGTGDGNDDWKLDVEGGGAWLPGKRVTLAHVMTSHVLHSHAGHSHPQWTAGQQEVTGYRNRDDNDWWFLSEIR